MRRSWQFILRDPRLEFGDCSLNPLWANKFPRLHSWRPLPIAGSSSSEVVPQGGSAGEQGRIAPGFPDLIGIGCAAMASVSRGDCFDRQILPVLRIASDHSRAEGSGMCPRNGHSDEEPGGPPCDHPVPEPGRRPPVDPGTFREPRRGRRSEHPCPLVSPPRPQCRAAMGLPGCPVPTGG